MKKLQLKDLRRAIAYVNQGNNGAKDAHVVSEEELLGYKIGEDLKMGNIRITNVLIELERIHGKLNLIGKVKVDQKDTVKDFLDAINNAIKD